MCVIYKRTPRIVLQCKDYILSSWYRSKELFYANFTEFTCKSQLHGGSYQNEVINRNFSLNNINLKVKNEAWKWLTTDCVCLQKQRELTRACHVIQIRN